MSKPTQAILLARISDDDHGVSAQLGDLRRHAEHLGWGVAHEIVENDTSAFKRKKIRVPGQDRPVLRTVRPGFRKALAMLASGEADGLIAVDLDRACRDPRDLEDLIDVVEAQRVQVESITGSLRLGNDADITMARVHTAIANKSSRDTARRVADARRHQATEGRNGGGGRCFGYVTSGMELVPHEADAIRSAAKAILAGASVRSIARDWNARGLYTVRGKPWEPSWLRQLLMRPRLAGIATYKGEETGRAKWPAILDEATWRALAAILSDPGRRTNQAGAEPRHLGSGLFLCGQCETGVQRGTGGRTYEHSYVCPNHHLRRQAEPVDLMVTVAVTERLAQPNAAKVFRPPETGPDVVDLHRQAAALRVRLNEQAALHAQGDITTAQLTTGSRIIKGELEKVERQLARSVKESPLDGIAGRADAAEVFAGLPLWRQRAIIEALVTVKLMPAKLGRQRGGGYFDLNSVKIEWKR